MNVKLNHQDIVNAIAYYLRHVKKIEADTMILSSKDERICVATGAFYDEYQIKSTISAEVKIK